jgi:hypothetical protein
MKLVLKSHTNDIDIVSIACINDISNLFYNVYDADGKAYIHSGMSVDDLIILTQYNTLILNIIPPISDDCIRNLVSLSPFAKFVSTSNDILSRLYIEDQSLTLGKVCMRSAVEITESLYYISLCILRPEFVNPTSTELIRDIMPDIDIYVNDVSTTDNLRAYTMFGVNGIISYRLLKSDFITYD